MENVWGDITAIPVMHAVELVAKHLNSIDQRSALLLATKFTMEDGFFAETLQQHNISVTLPDQGERERMDQIHAELMQNTVTQKSRDYFASLIKKYQSSGVVILGCTEYPLVVDSTNSVLPIVNPICLQVSAAVNYALSI